MLYITYLLVIPDSPIIVFKQFSFTCSELTLVKNVSDFQYYHTLFIVLTSNPTHSRILSSP